MDSYDLFDGNPPAQRHSATSVEAATKIKTRIGPMHWEILAWLNHNPLGACDERMGDELKIGPNTFRPRRRELQLMGRVKDSGRTERTRSGSNAVIWVKS